LNIISHFYLTFSSIFAFVFAFVFAFASVISSPFWPCLLFARPFSGSTSEALLRCSLVLGLLVKGFLRLLGILVFHPDFIENRSIYTHSESIISHSPSVLPKKSYSSKRNFSLRFKFGAY